MIYLSDATSGNMVRNGSEVGALPTCITGCRNKTPDNLATTLGYMASGDLRKAVDKIVDP